MKKKKYAVVIATYGEVEKLTLRNLWPSSRRIVKVITRQIVKVPKLLIYFIADYRSTRHYIDWRLHNYESTLVSTNRIQTGLVASRLRQSEHPVFSRVEADVVEAYFFVPPYLEETLQHLEKEYDGVIVVPMIPVESAFSCGVACQMVSDVYGDHRFENVRVLNKLWQDPELHRLYTDYLFQRVDRGYIQKCSKTGLVLVIHGTLVRDRAGNPPKVFTGLDETSAFFHFMKERIMGDKRNVFDGVKQGCMNHSAGGEWTSDTIEKALDEFHEEGYDSVVMFPYGFFADNSETEYEAQTLLEKSPIPYKQYIRCINGSPDFATWLSGRIIDELELLSNLQKTFEQLEPTQELSVHD
ncbi:ferrochelatase [Prosthecochloris sp. N3]|uniref:coproporphyrin ferrochelatase n=1 Tax=Prosthecochloris ethylica TaxID=2743976 RepID=A0ABR9XT46_9CHLB|nr:ferrochelatase [Prosthecochloris ethylica]MBF0637000.1 ferrochelatase [Prosthecochloris ethylica]NUK47871.1 ferrochelatase [Prosthecochloris ethylica]